MVSHIVRVQGFFDDEPTTKKLYFHLSRREMFDFVKRYDNITNFNAWVEAAIANNDLHTMMEFFDDLIGSAYGERQGERFIKNAQIKESFLNSPEYEELFDQLMNKPNLVREFYAGILPEKIMKQVKDDPKYKELDDKLKETELNNL